jgi:hypothetical protein
VLAISGFGYVFFKTSALTITSYELVGVPAQYEDALQSELRTIAGKKFFLFMPANRIVTYRGAKIKTLITQILPDTATVTFRPVGLHTLRITVTKYQPVFRMDATHAVTENGVVYRPLDNLTSLPELVVASSSTETTTKDGISANRLASLPDGFIQSVSELIPKVNSVVFQVHTVTLDDSGDISFVDGTGKSTIKINSSSDINKVWSNLVSAIDTNPLKLKLASEKDKLEYLDARFGNKVFFKFTNGGKTTIINASTTFPYVTSATTTLH